MVDSVGGHRGMHFYDFELCPALQSAGVEVTLLTCDETKNVAIPPSLRVEFPFQSIYGDAPKAVRGFRYLRGLLRTGLTMWRRGIPLAHFHYLQFLPLDYLYLKWLHLIGKRFVLTVHDVVPFDVRTSDLAWLRRIYHEADRVIVHTADSQRVMSERFGVGADRIRVISHGPFFHFSQEQIVPACEAKQRLGLDADTPLILFFGQIKKVKGLQYLIRAFRQVVDDCPTARLVIAGPEWKDSFADYANLISDFGLVEEVITRIEYVPDEEVGLYFSAADVVALPYTESFQSGVLYMALSFAKPVVASAVGGLAEVVEDGTAGLLVPPANAERLAEALLILLQDAEMGRSMGEKGQALVERRFVWTEIARKTAAVYREVLYGGQANA